MVRGPRLSDYAGFIVAAEEEARAAAAALEADAAEFSAEPVFTRARRLSHVIRSEAEAASAVPTSHRLGGSSGSPPAHATGMASFMNPSRWQGGGR